MNENDRLNSEEAIMAAKDDYKGVCLENSVGGVPVVSCFVRGSSPKRYVDIDYQTYDSEGIQPPRNELAHCRPGVDFAENEAET